MKRLKYSEIKELINLTLNLESMKELGIGDGASKALPRIEPKLGRATANTSKESN